MGVTGNSTQRQAQRQGPLAQLRCRTLKLWAVVPRGKRKDKTGKQERNVTTCKAATGDKGRILIF